MVPSAKIFSLSIKRHSCFFKSWWCLLYFGHVQTRTAGKCWRQKTPFCLKLSTHAQWCQKTPFCLKLSTHAQKSVLSWSISMSRILGSNWKAKYHYFSIQYQEVCEHPHSHALLVCEHPHSHALLELADAVFTPVHDISECHQRFTTRTQFHSILADNICNRGCAFNHRSTWKGIEQPYYPVTQTIHNNTVLEPWIPFLCITLSPGVRS